MNLYLFVILRFGRLSHSRLLLENFYLLGYQIHSQQLHNYCFEPQLVKGAFQNLFVYVLLKFRPKIARLATTASICILELAPSDSLKSASAIFSIIKTFMLSGISKSLTVRCICLYTSSPQRSVEVLFNSRTRTESVHTEVAVFVAPGATRKVMVSFAMIDFKA